MPIYAILNNPTRATGKVVNIAQSDIAQGVNWINLSSVDVRPRIGSFYDGVEFKPAGKAKELKQILIGEFWGQVPRSIRDDIRTSLVPDVIATTEVIKLKGELIEGDPDIDLWLDALVSASIITQQQADNFWESIKVEKKRKRGKNK